MTRSGRLDGSSLVNAWFHYNIKPWINPVRFWRNELRHIGFVLADPIGHELGHQKAVLHALQDGRPLDAFVARFNDMWEPRSDHQHHSLFPTNGPSRR